MSLDLVVLAPESAKSYEQALGTYYDEDAGAPDHGAVAMFVLELSDMFAVDDWPLAGDPIVFPTHVLLTIVPERWASVVPAITAKAHRHELVVLDPQGEALFPPGTKYADESKAPQRLRLEMTAYYADGTTEELGVVYDDSRWWRWGPGRFVTWLRLTRKAVTRAWRSQS